MAQRSESAGRGRRSARPTSGRRSDGRRSERRRDVRRTEARSVTPPSRSDAAGFDPGTPVVDTAADTAAVAGRVRGLSPKRAVVLALVLSVVALTLAVPLRTYFSQRSEADQLRATHSALVQQNSDLQRKVDAQSDPAYIEAQARDRLQFVRPGDKALVMQFTVPPEKSDKEKRAEQQAKNPWYSNLLDSVSTPVEK